MSSTVKTLVNVAGVGVGLLLGYVLLGHEGLKDILESMGISIVEAAEWNFASPRDKFKYKHLLDAFRVNHHLKTIRWDHLKWNAEIKRLMDFVAPGKQVRFSGQHNKQMPDFYGNPMRLTFVLTLCKDFQAVYAAHPVEQNPWIVCGLQRTQQFQMPGSPVQQGNDVTYYPELCKIMFATWSRERDIYDVYIIDRQIVLIAYHLVNGIVKRPNHFEGFQSAKPNEDNAKMMCDNTDHAQRQCRFKQAEHLTNWLHNSRCVHVPPKPTVM